MERSGRLGGPTDLARRAFSVLLAMASASLLVATGASAATIVVGPTDDAAPNSFDDSGCTLRDAVQAANDNAHRGGTDSLGCDGDTTGHDTIILQSGKTYTLTQNAVDDTNAKGDLDITGGGGTTIQSNGPGLATIDGNGLTALLASRDRVIDVLPVAGPVTLRLLRVQNGFERSGTVASSGGGGIHNKASLSVIDSEITGNNVTDNGVNPETYIRGGGIFNDGGSLTLTRSTVANNTANDAVDGEGQGGGIANLGGPLTATNSTISSNVAKEDPDGFWDPIGGGIWQTSAVGTTMTLTNVTITGNSVISAGNPPEGDGGGIYIAGVGASDTIGGTIIAGNTAPGIDDCYGTVYSSSNLIGAPAGCTLLNSSNDLTGVPALLGPLSNYGGPTSTHLLNAGSPAINHGGSCPETDQRGFFRFNVPPCDSGSVEVGASTTPPPTPVTPAPAPAAAPPLTGLRDAALAKCKKKKCRKAANLLPLRGMG